jgi:hypothetical protein
VLWAPWSQSQLGAAQRERVNVLIAVDLCIRTIFIIRHGEKPDKGSFGVDVFWQPERAFAATARLAPRRRARDAVRTANDVFRSGLMTPTELSAPGYGNVDKDVEHRTHQTILPLARLSRP